MLKIEVIRFEAQDVITASTAAPDYPKELDNCTCPQFKCGAGQEEFSHSDGCTCPNTGTATDYHWWNK